MHMYGCVGEVPAARKPSKLANHHSNILTKKTFPTKAISTPTNMKLIFFAYVLCI